MSHAMTRRDALLATLALAAGCAGTDVGARAGAWPSTHVRIIVGGAAGSVPDALARIAADALAARLGQPVIIDDRPGAGGILAMDRLIHSEPDGYTIALATVSQAVFNPYLFATLPYDPRRDLVPIAKLVATSFVLAANPSLGADSLAQVVALSQREPDRLLIGVPANGSPPHIAAILLLQKTGLKAKFVPFRSGPDALSSAIRGDIHLLVDGPTLIAPQVKDRKLEALAVTGHERQDALADVPTLAEADFKDAECESWMGLFAPRGTPPEIIARINRESRAILESAAYLGKLKALSFLPQSTSPEEFAAFIGAEHARWSDVLRSSGLKLE